MEGNMDTEYDILCKTKFDELLASEPRHAGYSPSQLLSVMTVVGCDSDKAKRLIDGLAEFGAPDWSEATWDELRGHFVALQYFLGE